jgi:Protein of unknown function (DUF3828)
MPTRRSVLFLAAYTLVITCGMTWGITCYVMTGGMSRSLAATPAAVADATAKAFVTKIYDSYKGKNSKGVPIATEAAIRTWFEPALAALIIKDEQAAAKRKDVPALDFDPFVDGQEWEISDVSITVSEAPPDKAVATVSFKNFGLPTKIVLNLVGTTKTNWRIANITWQRGDSVPETLRALFKH